MIDYIPTKTCSKCHAELPATTEFFHRRKNSPDGLREVCKTCRKPETRQYYDLNKDKVLSANAEWREKHPEKMREYKDKYVNTHPERVLKSKSDYYDSHSDQVYEKTKRYREQSPEQYEAHKTVQIAVQLGKLAPIKSQICQHCGKQARHYHHWSYLPEHQLDVIPLCTKCHKKVHSQ